MKWILIGLLALALVSGLKAKMMVADMYELVKDMSCIQTNGYGRLIFRGLMKTGQPDPNAKENLLRTTKIDSTLYLMPCFKCGNPRKQIQDTCTAIDGTGFLYRPYVTVEDPQDWSTDTAANREFLETIADEILSQHKCFDSVGFRTTKFEWEKILGADYSKFSTRRLWYVSTDRKQNFDDFKPFGGWKTPFLKQFIQNEGLCENLVNLDFQLARIPPEPSKVALMQAS